MAAGKARTGTKAKAPEKKFIGLDKLFDVIPSDPDSPWTTWTLYPTEDQHERIAATIRGMGFVAYGKEIEGTLPLNKSQLGRLFIDLCCTLAEREYNDGKRFAPATVSAGRPPAGTPGAETRRPARAAARTKAKAPEKKFIGLDKLFDVIPSDPDSPRTTWTLYITEDQHERIAATIRGMGFVAYGKEIEGTLPLNKSQLGRLFIDLCCTLAEREYNGGKRFAPATVSAGRPPAGTPGAETRRPARAAASRK